jgi:hypothetical protein
MEVTIWEGGQQKKEKKNTCSVHLALGCAVSYGGGGVK